MPDQPAGVDVATLKLVMLTGGDLVVQLSQADWKAVLARDLAWQAAWTAAKRCEVLPMQVEHQ